jgi:hypothetical protein
VVAEQLLNMELWKTCMRLIKMQVLYKFFKVFKIHMSLNVSVCTSFKHTVLDKAANIVKLDLLRKQG